MRELELEIPSSTGGVLRFWIALGILGAPLVWLLVSISRALLSQTHGLIRHAVVSQILVKAYVATMLVLALATIGFKTSEGYWFSREKLGKIDPGKPGWTAFEYDVAVEMRQELREILEGSGS